MAAITFPNYTQIPSRLSLTAWRTIRAAVWLGALVVAGLLVAVPDTGLKVMWKGVIPALPLLFMVAPGVWRKRRGAPTLSRQETGRRLDGLDLRDVDEAVRQGHPEAFRLLA